MSLYTSPSFTAHDRAAVAQLLRDYPFATLVTPSADGLHISHVPLLFVPGCEPHGTLIGHVARSNPHWQHAQDGESIAIFQGPHAYVTPSWYEHPERMVPTWNYAVAHAHGTLEVIDDAVETRRVLDALVQRFEHARPVPWNFAMPAQQRDAMVGAIVAFRLRVKRLEAKFKMSQNRSAEDRRRVTAGLAAEGDAESLATAGWMAAYANPVADPGATR